MNVNRLFITFSILFVFVAGIIQLLYLSSQFSEKRHQSQMVSEGWQESHSLQSQKQEIMRLHESKSLVTYNELKWALFHTSEQIRSIAISSIANDMSREAMRYLIDRIYHDPSPDVRCKALRIVAGRKKNELPSILANALADQSVEVQSTALNIIVQNRDKELVPVIIERAAKSGPTYSQLLALGMLSTDESIEFLVDEAMLDQRFSPVCFVLLSNIPEASLPHIINRLKNRPDLKQASILIEVFKQIKSDSALDALITLSEDANANVRELAVRSLGYLGAEEAQQRLELMSRKEKNESVARAIEETLNGIRDEGKTAEKR